MALMISGCFPDRRPLAPVESETRRPEIAYMKPVDGEQVSRETDIELWFDELMDIPTIENAFGMSIVVEEEPWNHIQSVATLDQNPSDPSQLFLGRRERGALRSSDGGDTWQFVRALAAFTIGLVRFDPANASVIYVATDSVLLKSTDGGVTVHQLKGGLPAILSISSLAFGSPVSGLVWLGTDQGIYRSDNAGETWSLTGELPGWRNDKPVVDIAVDPSNDAIIYAATLGRYIYKSIDGGVTWEMKRGTTDRLPGSRIHAVAVDQNDHDIVYVATDNKGIYKSADAGENWASSSEGMDDLTPRLIRIDPNDAGMIYVASGKRLYLSTDGAVSWSAVTGPPEEVAIVNVAIDHANGTHLTLAVSDNIYMSVNSGASWDMMNVIDPASISITGSYSSDSWRGELTFIEADGDTIAIAPYRYDNILAGYDAGFIDEPPADPDPVATKITFNPDEDLLPQWMYRVSVQGAFLEAAWRGQQAGARDIHGMSMEFDYISFFTSE